jgi:hypothetical protein
MAPDFYYFATVSRHDRFFDRADRLSAAVLFPHAGAIRTGMICGLGQLNLNLIVVNDAQERLGAGPRALTTPRCKSSSAELAETLVAGMVGLQNPTQLDRSEGEQQQ